MDKNPVLGTKVPCKSSIYRGFFSLLTPLFAAYFDSFRLTDGTQFGTQK